MRGQVLLQGGAVSGLSVRDALDMTYAIVLDGTSGDIGLFEAKQRLDRQLLMIYPDREGWGVDADELDLIPSAYDQLEQMTEDGYPEP